MEAQKKLELLMREKDFNTATAVVKRLLILSVSAMGFMVITAQAQQLLGIDPDYSGKARPYGLPQESTGTGMKVGDSSLLYPAVGISATQDDNRYRTEVFKQSTTRYNLRPALAIHGGKQNKHWNLGYFGNYATYSEDGVGLDGEALDDDYTDHNVNASFSSTARKTRGKIYADYQRGHDERGENIFVGFDIWDQYRVLGDVTFGAAQAKLNFRLDGEYITREQDYNKSLDRDTTSIGGTLMWRVSSKTHLVAETAYQDYDLVNSNGSYSQAYLRGGVTWEATGKTTGIFTIGTESTDPENEGEPIVSDATGPTFGINEKSSDTSWKGIIRWTPTLRDTVSIDTSQGTRLTSGFGSSKLSTEAGAAWDHIWGHHIATLLAYRAGVDDYRGVDREDDLKRVQFGLSYKPIRDMILGANWHYEERDSNLILESYDRNLFELSLDYEF